MESKVAQAVDAIWEGWLASFKMFEQYQTELEKKTVQAFSAQKQAVETTKEHLHKLKEETRRWETELLTYFQETWKTASLEHIARNSAEWNNKLLEINEKLKQLAWTPNQAGAELLSQNCQQWEAALQSILEQQQNNRKELLLLVQQASEQMKATQKSVLSYVESFLPKTAASSK